MNKNMNPKALRDLCVGDAFHLDTPTANVYLCTGITVVPGATTVRYIIPSSTDKTERMVTLPGLTTVYPA